MATINTTDPKPGFIYDAATDTWFPLAGIAPASNIVRWRKTAVGAETSVSGLDDLGATLSYNAGTEQVYLNGVLLVRTEDYLATNGTSVTGLTALAASDVIEVISFNATNVQTTDALLETDINAKGDLIVGAAVDTAAILAVGTNGQVLAVNTSTATGLEWVTSDDANAIQNAIVDAKGDLIVATAADTVARLASSASNGDLLTVDTSTATGLKWAAPASGGGYTSLATGSFSGTSTSVNITTTGYKELRIFAKDVSVASADFNIDLRFNSDTGNNYSFVSQYSSGTTTATQEARSASDAFFVDALDAGDLSYYVFTIYDPAITDGHKIFSGWFMGRDGVDTYNSAGICNGRYMSDSAITNVTFYTGGTAVTSGTYEIYGVK